MSNKKIALIITLFIVGLFILIGLMGLFSHIPFIGKGLALIFAVILIIFVLAVVIFASKRKK